MNYSKNGAGILLLVLSLLGINISEANAVEFVSAVGQILSIGLLIWNQIKRGDVDKFFFKK